MSWQRGFRCACCAFRTHASRPPLPQRAAQSPGGGAKSCCRLFRVRPGLPAVGASGRSAAGASCYCVLKLLMRPCCYLLPSAGLPSLALVSLLQTAVMPRRSVRTFAEAYEALGAPLHVLALNAGSFLWPYRK